MKGTCVVYIMVIISVCFADLVDECVVVYEILVKLIFWVLLLVAPLCCIYRITYTYIIVCALAAYTVYMAC